MKKLLIALCLTLTFALPCFAEQYKVLKVVDGDTIDISCNGKKERVRMLCVDTPESVHPDQSRNTEMGLKASAYTKKRLSGKFVDLEFETRKRGNYGRLLAYVILAGENFNIELVKNGWSKYYIKYGKSEKHHSEFSLAEKSAKAAKLNIWVSTLNEPKAFSQSESFPIVYHGNRKSHKFHKPSCRWYNCKNCTKIFNSRQDAINAGYVPCKICKP